ncbi:hypothetical protein GCM10009304_10480 [Pseudomonas matsuisoli]|uniref:Uncharacterized protein n=2 Tax=Pseudomonas matsuisoli TaxID=1515666 RepID=A0A917UUM9_9PSED|nr:hypothetical protein GCM10009304_10480 [Pseudomonas matsuisoli]
MRESIFVLLRESLVASALLTLVIGAILWQAGSWSLALRYAVAIGLGLGLITSAVTAYAGRDRHPLQGRALIGCAVLGAVLTAGSVVAIWNIG